MYPPIHLQPHKTSLVKHIPPSRVFYWKEEAGEVDYMLVGTLGGGEHDRVCGFIYRGENEWEAVTLGSGGAKATYHAGGLSRQEAEHEVEARCR